MFCNQCGKSMDENAKFCNQCGNLMEEEIEAVDKFCNQCGNKIEKGQLFCAKCGKSLEDMMVKPATKTDSPVKKKKNLMPLIITAGVAIFFIAAVFIGFKLKDNSKPISVEIPSKELERDIGEESEDIKEDIKEDIEEEEITLTEDDPVIDEPEEIRGNVYLFPSDRMYINEDHLDSLTREEIALIRNEVFARHGYIFTKEPYISYFSSMPWYVPDENFTDSVFTEIEKTNVDNIVIYERKMGWN